MVYDVYRIIRTEDRGTRIWSTHVEFVKLKNWFIASTPEEALRRAKNAYPLVASQLAVSHNEDLV